MGEQVSKCVRIAGMQTFNCSNDEISLVRAFLLEATVENLLGNFCDIFI